METFDLHAQILCASEGFVSEYILTHNVCIETFALDVQILYASEGIFSLLFRIHIVNIVAL